MLLIHELVTSDVAWLEEIHALCFDDIQRWAAALFSTMLIQHNVKGFAIIADTAPVGFIITRRAADEAEILTLAIHPDNRRKGYAELLMNTFTYDQKNKGLKSTFLEVIVTNHAAITLYKKMGFNIVATRPNYYQMPAGSEKPFMDCYVMKKTISDNA
jgi:[ribosomal protein S18]-alanine N-acetyltransferase